MESGLDTGAEIAGKAIQKGLPSRPDRGGSPSGDSQPGSSGLDSQHGGSEGGPDSTGPNSPAEADIPNTPGSGANTPGSNGGKRYPGTQDGSPNAPGGDSDGPGGGQNPSGNLQGEPGSGSPEGSDPGAAKGGADGGAAGSGAGTSGASASGSGAGASGSAAGGSGGAAAGGAASSGGAAAGGSIAAGSAAGGAAAGAASGAATGAAAGSVAGPAGTAIGAAAGALLVPILKVVFATAATIVVFLSFFLMHPSFLYDNSSAANDRGILEDTYNSYYGHIRDEYEKDIRSQMNAAWRTTDILSGWPMKKAEQGDLSGIFSPPATYPYVSMPEEDREKILEVVRSNAYDAVEFQSATEFLFTEDEYLENASSNINLVLSLIDTQKKHWFISLFEDTADAITGGMYSRFTDWVAKKWEGFWNDFILYDLYSITAGEIKEVTRVEVTNQSKWDEAVAGGDDPSAYEKEIAVAVVQLVYTYDLKDQGVGYYADKLNLDREQIDRATEMAHYLGGLFGSHSEVYFGWYVRGGYHTDAVQGGGVGANIAAALEKLDGVAAGMEFDPAADPQVFPLQGYTTPPMSSAYGPRNFAADPWHTGIDFSAPGGTPVRPVADGVVLFIAQMPTGYGNYIVVYHGEHNGEPVSTMYAHLSAFGAYRAGDRVGKSDVIGYVGTTGLSTGNHLHLEAHIGGSRYNPVEVLDVFSYLKP